MHENRSFVQPWDGRTVRWSTWLNGDAPRERRLKELPPVAHMRRTAPDFRPRRENR